MPDLSRGARGAAAQLVLYGTLAVFVLVLGGVIVSAFSVPDQPEFAPTPVAPRALDGVGAADTVTIEAGVGGGWQFFDFDRRSVVMEPDTSGWDLAVRRFNIIVSGGAIALEDTSFAAVTEAPASGYVATSFGRDTTNAALARWYTYGMMTHVLEPKDGTYVVRTTDGNHAKLRILSYYCEGLLSGCLTFHYVYRADGSTTLD